MAGGGLSRVDWERPWNAHWRAAGERVAARTQAGAPLHQALNAEGHGAVPIFVPQSELPDGVAYEQFIFDTGRCPTREGLHDFFHGLCWLHFPQAKRQLNALQAQELRRLGVAARRGAVRDAITVFDENGALLEAPPALWEALLAREWRRLFVELRPLWRQARLRIFGHALLEKLATPRKNLTAHVWHEPCPPGELDEVDAWLAARASAERLAAKPFTPLPVLGVPGWCAENENFSFYDDSLVFRPRKAPTNTTTALQPGPARP